MFFNVFKWHLRSNSNYIFKLKIQLKYNLTDIVFIPPFKFSYIPARYSRFRILVKNIFIRYILLVTQDYSYTQRSYWGGVTINLRPYIPFNTVNSSTQPCPTNTSVHLLIEVIHCSFNSSWSSLLPFSLVKFAAFCGWL